MKFTQSIIAIEGPPPQTKVVLTAVATGDEPTDAPNLFAYQGLKVRIHDQSQSNCIIDFGKFVLEPNKVDGQCIRTAFQIGADFHIQLKILPEFDNVGKGEGLRPDGFMLLYRWSVGTKGLDGGLTQIKETGPIRLPPKGVHEALDGWVNVSVSFEIDQPLTPVIGFGAIQVISVINNGQTPNTHEMYLLEDSSYAASKK